VILTSMRGSAVIKNVIVLYAKQVNLVQIASERDPGTSLSNQAEYRIVITGQNSNSYLPDCP
jgi:hypothetical protein